jgi:hypothetical protein
MISVLIASGRRLNHRSCSCGEETGEQNARLNLSAGDGEAVFDRVKVAAADQ